MVKLVKLIISTGRFNLLRMFEESAENLDDRLEVVTLAIIAAAQNEVSKRYASESYHNPAHSLFVREEALALANALPKAYRLTPKERCILSLVASAHDVCYEHNPRKHGYQGKNEREAAAWLREKMQEHPEVFNDADRAVAEQAILATWARPHPLKNTGEAWSEETTIQQNVGENGQTPRHIIAQLLCDADLAGLGSPWEIEQSTMTGYYLELQPDGGTLEEWKEYLTLQCILLKNRVYYTQVARNRYGENLKENIGEIERILGNAVELARSHTGVQARASRKQTN